MSKQKVFKLNKKENEELFFLHRLWKSDALNDKNQTKRYEQLLKKFYKKY